MQNKFYFTRSRAAMYSSDLISAMEEELADNDYSDEPEHLNDGALYRVTIERVGVVRTTKEIEMDGEGN